MIKYECDICNREFNCPIKLKTESREIKVHLTAINTYAQLSIGCEICPQCLIKLLKEGIKENAK